MNVSVTKELETSVSTAIMPDKTDHAAAFDGFEGTIGEYTVDNPKISTRNVDVFYGEKQAIFDASLDIGRNEVIALIGPSGCGKSTYLRALNRIGYEGPLSVEWEDAGMDREHGAAEACEFVRALDFPPSETAFDAAFSE